MGISVSSRMIASTFRGLAITRIAKVLSSAKDWKPRVSADIFVAKVSCKSTCFCDDFCKTSGIYRIMKIGYARVSTPEQNPDLQLQALKPSTFMSPPSTESPISCLKRCGP